MSALLKITKTFAQGDELWHEARAPGQMRVTFRAPARAPLKIGDAIEFDPVLADQDSFLPVYESRTSTQIRIRKCDIVDMRSLAVKREFRRDGIAVITLATGEIELHGPDPRRMIGFDDADGFERHIDAAGSDIPAPIAAWLRESVIPELKDAR